MIVDKEHNVNCLIPSQLQLSSLLEHYQNGRFVDAEKLAVSIIDTFPKHPFGWKVLGAILKQTDRISEALNANQKVVELSPQDAEAHNNLGVTIQDMGRLEDAEASYRQAILLKYDYFEAYNNLGNSLIVLGRLEDAELSLRQAILLRSDFALARYNLGICLFNNKRYDLALKEFELIDMGQSKTYAMRCSYLMDKEIIFYKKLATLIDQGETNAVIGSLSCSAEIKYGIKTLNPFCNEPLKYILKTDLSEQYDFDEIFIKTARDVLSDNSISRKSQELLTNGIQTAGNIFAVKKISETEIESIIYAEVEKYRFHFKDSDEGFIRNWPTSYKIKGWLVSMRSGGKLASHMHELGWISGSIYINVPVKKVTDSGNLVLCLNEQKQEHSLKIKNSQESVIDVETGILCLFTSSLHHYTVPFEDKENRIVLAFDVIPIK